MDDVQPVPPFNPTRREFIALSASAAALAVMEARAADGAPVSDRGIVLEGIEALYDPAYTALESGYRRLDSGHLVVAAHHRMIGCTGAMVAWWLGKTKTPEEFTRWHPRDHISIEPVEDVPPDPGRTGGVSRVKQYVGGTLNETIIEGRDPAEYFDLDRLNQSGISAAICSRGKLVTLPFWGTRVIHVCRDEAWGCEMRSRFWLGPFAPADAQPPAELLRKQLPDTRAAGLLRHTLEEYTYLSAFLPEAYRARD